MSLGAGLWKSREGFYNGLTLLKEGISLEREFASRPALVGQFSQLESFWKRHVCPATMRPKNQAFCPGVSEITEQIARASYSVMGRLIDADDSLAKVRAGDLGPHHRNWRDAIEAAGNALQLNSKLQLLVADRNPKKPSHASLAGQLGLMLDPFPDWKSHWASNREMAAMYRNYLVHDGLVYTVTLQTSNQVLVLGPDAFAAGASWRDAVVSYQSNPHHWRSLADVAQGVLDDTIAFLDLTYSRLLGVLDPLLVNPAYQALWGWTAAPVLVTSSTPAPVSAIKLASLQACSASTTIISSETIIKN